jgi:carboxylesterase
MILLMQEQSNHKASFLLEGYNGKAVFLVHGITGTPTELRFFANELNNAGYTVLCNMLPGHGSTMKELKRVRWQEIYSACERDFLRLQKRHKQSFVGGLSIGALVAMHLACLHPDKTSGIVGLGPTLFYDGWAQYKGRFLLDFVWHIPILRQSIVVRESWPYGLKDEALRDKVDRYYKRIATRKISNNAATFGTPYFPIACLYQGYLLSKLVKKELPLIKCPLILFHSSNDDMASAKNSQYIYDRIGSADKSLILLENSYHMITIDQDRERVARETVNFLDQI